MKDERQINVDVVFDAALMASLYLAALLLVISLIARHLSEGLFAEVTLFGLLIVGLLAIVVNLLVNIRAIPFAVRMAEYDPISLDELMPERMKFLTIAELPEREWRSDSTPVRYIEIRKKELYEFEAMLARLRQYEMLFLYYTAFDWRTRDAMCSRGEMTVNEAVEYHIDQILISKAFRRIATAWQELPDASAELVNELDRLYRGDARKTIRDIEDRLRVLERRRPYVLAGSLEYLKLDDEVHALRRDVVELNEFVAQRNPHSTIDELYRKEFLPRIRYEAKAKIDQAENRIRAEMDRFELRAKLRAEVAQRFADRREREQLFRRIDRDLGIAEDDGIFIDNVSPFGAGTSGA